MAISLPSGPAGRPRASHVALAQLQFGGILDRNDAFIVGRYPDAR